MGPCGQGLREFIGSTWPLSLGLQEFIGFTSQGLKEIYVAQGSRTSLGPHGPYPKGTRSILGPHGPYLEGSKSSSSSHGPYLKGLRSSLASHLKGSRWLYLGLHGLNLKEFIAHS